MTTQLLALSIGPVQEFIAAARRTRDLWFGSFLLSELSKAAANAVAQWPNVGVQRLIFPSPEDAAALAPTGNDKDEPNLAVANIILAELPEGVAVREIIEKAQEAVQIRWREFATEARQVVDRTTPSPNVLRENLWENQLDDATEFYAAWTPIQPEEYGKARARVMRLLAGRKACRDFDPAQGQQGVPKSSLDGRRESVLQKDIPQAIRTRLRLNKGEQLCAVGLTKRLAGGTPSYPSVSRIAADPWLRAVARAATTDDRIAGAFERLKSLCSEFHRRGCLYTLGRRRFPQFKDFPYEGECLFPNRFEDWKAETDLHDEDLDLLLGVLDELESLMQCGPDPYLAILVADGDRMGKMLSAMTHPDDHRRFSLALAQFASSAYDIIGDHNGVCVFAGGDDVLALLPVDQCIPCAQELHQRFASLKDVVREGHEPTLSVGIAIGHCLEPLEDLRHYGLRAEESAKHATPDADGMGRFGERDGLAIRIYPRSGVPFDVREKWQTGATSLDGRLEYWADHFAERKLPRKLPYDIRLLALDLDQWPQGAPKEAVAAEMRVLLKRKRVGKSLREELAQRLKDIDSAKALLRLSQEMLVAQWIADAQPTPGEDQEGM